MKCVICKSTNISIKTVEEEIRHGEDIVLVPLEVLVCSNCGERYYSRSVMHQLEDIKAKVQNQSVPLENVGKILRAKVA